MLIRKISFICVTTLTFFVNASLMKKSKNAIVTVKSAVKGSSAFVQPCYYLIVTPTEKREIGRKINVYLYVRG